jgi:hypothetical protein
MKLPRRTFLHLAAGAANARRQARRQNRIGRGSTGLQPTHCFLPEGSAGQCANAGVDAKLSGWPTAGLLGGLARVVNVPTNCNLCGCLKGVANTGEQFIGASSGLRCRVCPNNLIRHR